MLINRIFKFSSLMKQSPFRNHNKSPCLGKSDSDLGTGLGDRILNGTIVGSQVPVLPIAYLFGCLKGTTSSERTLGTDSLAFMKKWVKIFILGKTFKFYQN